MTIRLPRLKTLTLALGAALVASAPAYADPWDHRGPGPGFHGRDIGAVCSNGRARELEGRLRHAVDEHRIDFRAARRIHGSIERLQRRSDRACFRHDDREIHRIADQYDGISVWIDREASHRRW